ncbi:hypothetical protein [Paraburkholderia solisilvae]|uniref:hypothetical protein n=1 Tax=Paraburkholderia solisilvae TaxID=624376 RepID=UPI001FE42178|nr:hypothetical protein [Paraburkholderia solisilvae]
MALVLGVGAGLTIMVWPAGRPTNTLWFWFCIAGYPFLAWAFLLCAWLGYGHARRSEAIAANRVSAEAEQACHALASKSLAILGHAWCFSADHAENTLEEIQKAVGQQKLRASGSGANSDVAARWLEIPGARFEPGNELNESARHAALCGWLLEHLTHRLTPQLNALPRHTKLQIEFHVQSRMKTAVVEAQLRDFIAGKAWAGKVNGEPSVGQGLPLFRTDAWLDAQDPNVTYLLIAIELHDAISTVLPDGVAEAGVALLLGHPRLNLSPTSSALCLHRPARDVPGSAANAIELAARWAMSSIERVRTVWTHGLKGERMSTVRRATKAGDDTAWMALETSIGDCSKAGPWLALALAAENACITADPQLVLCEEDGNLVAVVCRK